MVPPESVPRLVLSYLHQKYDILKQRRDRSATVGFFNSTVDNLKIDSVRKHLENILYLPSVIHQYIAEK